MIRQIPFGDTTVAVTLPDDTFVIETEAREKLGPIDDLSGAMRSALAEPLGMAPIPELVKPGARVTIAFDDLTVPCYSPIRRVAIEEILVQLDAAGVDRAHVTLICGNGLHRKFPPNELATILGEDLVREFGDRLICHDAEDHENLSFLGTTENGYEVEISRYAAEADLTIYVTASHNRGFSGGWKSVCVGLGSWRSIRHHHGPDGMTMSVKDNRMHKVLDEMGRLVEATAHATMFKVDAIEVNPFQTAKIFAGSTWEGRKAAMEIMADLYPPRRSLSDTKYDVILYGIPNWSPYATYAKMNPILTLISSGLGYFGGVISALGKPGCTVILATPCPMQWDYTHHAPYPVVWEEVLSEHRDPYEIDRLFGERFATHEALIQKYRHEYSFHPIHGIMATHPLKRLKHAGRIIAAGIEEPATAQHLGYETAASVEEAIGMARDIHGQGCSIAYMDLPAVTSPTKVPM